MAVLLIFPPVWTPEAPFLSTAILTAYLRDRGIAAEQWDLNVQFWEYFYKPETISDIYSRTKALWKSSTTSMAQGVGPERIVLEQLASIIGLTRERFIYEVDAGIIPKNHYRSLIKICSEFSATEELRSSQTAAETVQGYHDLLYSDISCSIYAHDTKDLLSFVLNNANPFRAYFTNSLLSKIKSLDPAVIGLSIAAVNQVVPSLTIAHLVKEILPATHIVIGGSWCTQVHTNLSSKLALFPFIDSMVIYEGEEPLYQLCRAIESGDELDGIPNLYLRKKDSVSPPQRRFTVDMNQLPTPSFGGLPLQGYDFPQTLTLQASRGCYWGKCTFCSYPLLEPEYKARKSEKLIADIQRLQELHGVENIGFTDALLSPSFCRRFSTELLRLNVKVRWAMFARFERQFTTELLEQMAASGCSMVSWGLESANEDILRIIDKSISPAYAEVILAAAAEHAIHNRVLVMYGHPTEAFPQALETVNFLRRNLGNIHSISYNYYHPEMGTPIENLAARQGIQLERDDFRDLALGYKWESSLSREEKSSLKNLFNSLSHQAAARQAETGTATPRPQDLFEEKHSFTIAFPAENGNRTLLSTLVNRSGQKLRETFVLTEP